MTKGMVHTVSRCCENHEAKCNLKQADDQEHEAGTAHIERYYEGVFR